MWGADVGDAAGSGAGTEIDLYAGINFEFMVPMYVGVTGYYYTDNFDRDYEEINIGMDFGLFAIDAVLMEAIKVMELEQQVLIMVTLW